MYRSASSSRSLGSHPQISDRERDFTGESGPHRLSTSNILLFYASSCARHIQRQQCLLRYALPFGASPCRWRPHSGDLVLQPHWCIGLSCSLDAALATGVTSGLFSDHRLEIELPHFPIFCSPSIYPSTTSVPVFFAPVHYPIAFSVLTSPKRVP